MRKPMQILVAIFLSALCVAPVAVNMYLTTENSVNIQVLNTYIQSVEEGTHYNFKVATEVFKSHRAAMAVLRKDIQDQRDALEFQGLLTNELRKQFDIKLLDLQEQLSEVNYNLAIIAKALRENTPEALKEAVEVVQRYEYNKSLQATVFVYTAYYDTENTTKDAEGNVLPVAAGSGSGTMIFVKNGNTYILTAAHVVAVLEKTVWVEEELPSGEKRTVTKIKKYQPTITLSRYHLCEKQIDKYEAKVVSLDKERDLALLEITGFESKFLAPVIDKEDIEDITLHDEVYITGSPLGATPRVSRGRITAWIHAVSGYIESDCDLIWGNSGGAMFRNGKIIGIVSQGRGAMYQMVESLGLCVSPNLIHEFLDSYNEVAK